MSYRRPITFLSFVAVFLGLLAVPTYSQDRDGTWLRVITGEDSVVDVDRSSLALVKDQVIRARFRTVLSTPASSPEKPGLKYRTRLDLIQFAIDHRRYEIVESQLLDEAGKVVMSFSSTDADGSKPLRGRTANLFLSAASQLAPFGAWRIVAYRYASGEAASQQDPTELKSLVGSEMVLNLDRMVVGKQTCNTPVYSPKTVTNEDFFKRSGSSLESLGLPLDKVDVIRIACNGKDDFPSQTFILRLPGNKARLLWEGVFLEIERPGNPFLP